jgi:hypothetical protein
MESIEGVSQRHRDTFRPAQFEVVQYISLSAVEKASKREKIKQTATMRLDYVPNPPTDLAPEDQEVLERVKARRGAMGLIPLDLTLLHAPKIADGMLRSPSI